MLIIVIALILIIALSIPIIPASEKCTENWRRCRVGGRPTKQTFRFFSPRATFVKHFPVPLFHILYTAAVFPKCRWVRLIPMLFSTSSVGLLELTLKKTVLFLLLKMAQFSVNKLLRIITRIFLIFQLYPRIFQFKPAVSKSQSWLSRPY